MTPVTPEPRPCLDEETLGLRLVHLLDSVAARECSEQMALAWDDDSTCADLYPGQEPEGHCEPCQARGLLAELREMDAPLAPRCGESMLKIGGGGVLVCELPSGHIGIHRDGSTLWSYCDGSREAGPHHG